LQALDPLPVIKEVPMPITLTELTDVPEEQVHMIVADYRDDGASDVRTTRQPNGLWTVTATFSLAIIQATQQEVFQELVCIMQIS
jgi:hypothetical protein